MARQKPDTRQATETLHEIESIFDRVSAWATNNPARVLGVLGGILLLAALVGFVDWWVDAREDRAASALAAVRGAYFEALGGQAGDAAPPELPNPETAQRARQEAVRRFAAVAEEHSGTAAAVTALLEAGEIHEQLGDLGAAVATWRRAAEEAPAGSTLRALALLRLATGLERQGAWAEAGAAYAEAGAAPELPTRALALADAARAYAEAGDTGRALALYERARTAAGDDVRLPAHVTARLDALEAAEAR